MSSMSNSVFEKKVAVNYTMQAVYDFLLDCKKNNKSAFVIKAFNKSKNKKNNTEYCKYYLNDNTYKELTIQFPRIILSKINYTYREEYNRHECYSLIEKYPDQSTVKAAHEDSKLAINEYIKNNERVFDFFTLFNEMFKQSLESDLSKYASKLGTLINLNHDKIYINHNLINGKVMTQVPFSDTTYHLYNTRTDELVIGGKGDTHKIPPYSIIIPTFNLNSIYYTKMGDKVRCKLHMIHAYVKLANKVDIDIKNYNIMLDLFNDL